MSRIATVVPRINRKNYPPEYRTCDDSGKTTRLARIWYCMMWRVSDRSKRDRHRYFDRGIKVCPEWQYWPSFMDWAIAHGYSDELELDRINYDGDYGPENCRFVDETIQANNLDKKLAAESISKARLRVCAKTFRCLETGRVFMNKSTAEKAVGIGRGCIGQCLNGQFKSAGGFHWEYLPSTQTSLQ